MNLRFCLCIFRKLEKNYFLRVDIWKIGKIRFDFPKLIKLYLKCGKYIIEINKVIKQMEIISFRVFHPPENYKKKKKDYKKKSFSFVLILEGRKIFLYVYFPYLL